MVIVPPTSSRASSTALELGQKLVGVIREFQQSRPGTTSADIHRALRIAAIQTGAGSRRATILAVVLGLLLLGVLAALLFGTRGDGSTAARVMPALVAGLLLVALVGALLAKRK